MFLNWLPYLFMYYEMKYVLALSKLLNIKITKIPTVIMRFIMNLITQYSKLT